MRKSLIATTFGGVLAAALMVPVAHGAPPDPNFKIVVNGQDVSQDIVQFNHRPTGSNVTACTSLTKGTGQVMADPNNTFVMKHGAVTDVFIVDEPSNARPGSWAFTPDRPAPKPGDAQITKSGNVYRVTGHVTVIKGGSPGGLVPFEWDVTCS